MLLTAATPGLNLTPGFYASDEVQLAFMTALLKRTDLAECYYWLNELTTAFGEAAVQTFLWHLYYDFYYALRPELVSTFTGSLTELVQTLFVSPATPHVFLLCQTCPATPKIRYLLLGKPTAKWLAPFETRFHMLLRAVQKGHYHSFTYYLHQLLAEATGEEIVEVLCRYYKNIVVPLAAAAHTRNEIQYIMAIYVLLHLKSRAFTLTPPLPPALLPPAPVLPLSSAYAIPPEIASFQLQRWRLNNEEDLRADPVLKAMALASVYDVNVVSVYIKTQLSAAEKDQAYFPIHVPITAEEKQIILQAVREEHQHQHQAVVAKYYPTAADAADATRKHPLLWPTFGGVWLQAVFPAEYAADTALLDLIAYTLLRCL